MKETGPSHKEVKGEGFISRDPIIQISRQNNLEIIESMHFIKDDSHVGFYEMFILCFTAQLIFVYILSTH
jgi:hypothetical protein